MKIVVVGCGTSGNQIIPQLSNVLVIDRDIVEDRNLDRQKLFTPKDIGQPKALVLQRKLNVDARVMDLDYTNIGVLDNADLVIDCTDNLSTRFLINDYCAKNNIPWIYTGVVGDRGRVMAITGDYCFRCLHSEVKGLDTCTTAGVNLVVAKEMGSIAIEEVNKVLQGKSGRGLWANGDWVKVNRNSFCPTCNGSYEYLDGKQERVIKYCGSSRFQFKGNFDYNNVRERLGGSGDWFVYEDFYIFKDRVLVKAKNEQEAKKKFGDVIGF